MTKDQVSEHPNFRAFSSLRRKQTNSRFVDFGHTEITPYNEWFLLIQFHFAVDQIAVTMIDGIQTNIHQKSKYRYDSSILQTQLLGGIRRYMVLTIPEKLFPELKLEVCACTTRYQTLKLEGVKVAKCHEHNCTSNFPQFNQVE